MDIPVGNGTIGFRVRFPSAKGTINAIISKAAPIMMSTFFMGTLRGVLIPIFSGDLTNPSTEVSRKVLPVDSRRPVSVNINTASVREATPFRIDIAQMEF